MTGKRLILIALLILGLVYIAYPYFKWKMNRAINYNLDYKSQVQETVKEMVDPACIKQEYK